jgi:hypothetical protein
VSGCFFIKDHKTHFILLFLLSGLTSASSNTQVILPVTTATSNYQYIYY